MNFVAVKAMEQQAPGMLLRTRNLLARQRAQTNIALRCHLVEIGVVVPKGQGITLPIYHLSRYRNETVSLHQASIRPSERSG